MIRKDAVKMGESNGTTWGRRITRESEKYKSKALTKKKEAYEGLRKCMAEYHAFPARERKST